MQKILKIFAKGLFVGQKQGLCGGEITQAAPEKQAGFSMAPFIDLGWGQGDCLYFQVHAALAPYFANTNQTKKDIDNMSDSTYKQFLKLPCRRDFAITIHHKQ